jgi:hypothetical protein
MNKRHIWADSFSEIIGEGNPACMTIQPRKRFSHEAGSIRTPSMDKAAVFSASVIARRGTGSAFFFMFTSSEHRAHTPQGTASVAAIGDVLFALPLAFQTKETDGKPWAAPNPLPHTLDQFLAGFRPLGETF